MSGSVSFKNPKNARIDSSELPFDPWNFQVFVSLIDTAGWASALFGDQDQGWVVKIHHNEAQKRIFLIIQQVPRNLIAEWDLNRFATRFLEEFSDFLKGTIVDMVWAASAVKGTYFCKCTSPS